VMRSATRVSRALFVESDTDSPLGALRVLGVGVEQASRVTPVASASASFVREYLIKQLTLKRLPWWQTRFCFL